ncbi:MAG: glycosyltransferase family 4 protein [Patescibacteria group bacterium]
MKIVYILDDFLPYSSSSPAVLTFRLAQELKKQKHEVYVISRVGDKGQSGWQTYDGLKIYFIYSQYPKALQSYLSLFNFQTVFKVKKILKEINPTVVHFQHIHRYLSYYCCKLAKKYSQAVFLTSHDSMLFSYGKSYHFIDKDNLSVQTNFNYHLSWWQLFREAKLRYNPFRNIIIRHYLKYVDKIFAVSNALKAALSDNKIKNVETIYNSIDISDYQINQQQVVIFKEKYSLVGKPVIFFGGRLSRYKGGEQLILALARIVKEIPNVILLIAAEKKGNWGTMSRLIEKLNLNNQVVITGWLPPAEMATAFLAIDVCVTPSTCLDTFNLFNVEAMAAKKPVVGTCFGGTPEIIIDGVTGYIVNPLNQAMLAEKIIDLLKNPQRAKTFGEAGYQRVINNFSLEKQTQETLAWYNKYLID